MKTLKITLILSLLFVSLSSCTKQDLNENDTLTAPADNAVLFTGGVIDERN